MIAPLFVLALLAFVLLVTDRYLRISPLLEGFQEGGKDAQCGVDFPPCVFPLRCMNGYCKSDIQPVLPKDTGLPVLP
jgi:hypothetical protein